MSHVKIKYSWQSCQRYKTLETRITQFVRDILIAVRR